MSTLKDSLDREHKEINILAYSYTYNLKRYPRTKLLISIEALANSWYTQVMGFLIKPDAGERIKRFNERVQREFKLYHVDEILREKESEWFKSDEAKEIFNEKERELLKSNYINKTLNKKDGDYGSASNRLDSIAGVVYNKGSVYHKYIFPYFEKYLTFKWVYKNLNRK